MKEENGFEYLSNQDESQRKDDMQKRYEDDLDEMPDQLRSLIKKHVENGVARDEMIALLERLLTEARRPM